MAAHLQPKPCKQGSGYTQKKESLAHLVPWFLQALLTDFCLRTRKALSASLTSATYPGRRSPTELCNYMPFPSPSILHTLNLIINSQRASTAPPGCGVWNWISLADKNVVRQRLGDEPLKSNQKSSSLFLDLFFSPLSLLLSSFLFSFFSFLFFSVSCFLSRVG